MYTIFHLFTKSSDTAVIKKINYFHSSEWLREIYRRFVEPKRGLSRSSKGNNTQDHQKYRREFMID